jgi:hypothetical protein
VGRVPGLLGSGGARLAGARGDRAPGFRTTSLLVAAADAASWALLCLCGFLLAAAVCKNGNCTCIIIE